MAKGYVSFGTVVPGITLCKYSHSSSFYCRIYDSVTRTYTARSTGQKTEDEARSWVMNNLGTLFHVKKEERGGGANSTTRLLSKHIEYLRERLKAGEISEGTFIFYEKQARHWVKWFTLMGMKKLNDVKRTSLMHYGLNRVNEDGMSPNTVNGEIIYIRMWWTYLQDEEIIDRPLKVNSVQTAIENRTSNEPFRDGDLKTIHQTIKQWAESDSDENFGGISISKYNKQLFKLFIQLLDESGCRQHEVWNRTWSEIRIGETLTNRKRIINTISIPQKAKRGARQCVFRGDALFEIYQLQRKLCPNFSTSDFVFRQHQTNTQSVLNTFTGYWNKVRTMCEMDYKLHTFRSHRITELIMSGIEPQLVGRNLGLSLKQIESSYLRFAPSGHFDKLVQRELPVDSELKRLM
jgi:integrase